MWGKRCLARLNWDITYTTLFHSPKDHDKVTRFGEKMLSPPLAMVNIKDLQDIQVCITETPKSVH